MALRGQISGQPSWGTWIDALVDEHGSLAAVAERLAAVRGHTEDLASIERALRRLRARGSLPGGVWGDRVLRTFGLPGDIDARLRFMGSYHSRFVDLPVALCRDLVQLWDRPPICESRVGRVWLALARANIAMRERAWEEAAGHFATARTALPTEWGPVETAGAIEAALGEAHLVERGSEGVPEPLLAVPGWIARLEEHGAEWTVEAHNLRARHAGQVAHALNRAGRVAEGEALHRDLPDDASVPAFARSRRANGLAYARWRAGDPEAAVGYARAAARHAGDAGHVRLRAMALLMIARVAPDAAEGRDALVRAQAIAEALGDATLAARARRGAG